MEGISDFSSNLWYQFSKWRWGKTEYMRYAPWFLIPLLALMLWRILSGKRQRQKTGASASEIKTKDPIPLPVELRIKIDHGKATGFYRDHSGDWQTIGTADDKCQRR